MFADSLHKALFDLPPGSQETPLDPNEIGLVSGMRTMIDSVSGNSWMGPGDPMVPIAPATTLPRVTDYPFGLNSFIEPRQEQPGAPPFAMLRALAQYDIVRLCIETRIAQIIEMPMQWRAERQPGETKKNFEGRNTSDPRIKFLNQFFKFPDHEHSLLDWMGMMCEEIFVTDALAIWPVMNDKMRPISLRLIDGAYIKLLYDNQGWRPNPPNPAYQQIVKGSPALGMTAGLCENCRAGRVSKDHRCLPLIYKPFNPKVDRFYGFCYDSETEILTKDRGWQLFKDLLATDLVATRNAAREFEWQRPSAYVNEPYDGEMIKFSSRSMDLLVTPPHRMLASILNLARTATNEKIITADQFDKSNNHGLKIPVTSTWAGGKEIRDITFDGKNPLTISGDDYCALVGAYLAEGNIRTQGGIEIAQRTGSKGFSAFSGLVKRICSQAKKVGRPRSSESSGHNGRAFAVAFGCMTEHFKQFGHASEKFVPDNIRNATSRQLRIFWDHYILGDGHFQKKRVSKSGRGSHPTVGTSAVTVSKKLADHLVEIAQKLGWSASVSIRPPYYANLKVSGKVYRCLCQKSYKLGIRYSREMSAKTSRIQYSGIIHCVTVPNGIVYVRRNGKPCWSGNSPVEQILRTISIGMNRQLSQIAYYTDGNVPEAVAEVPADWGTDQIRQWQAFFDELSGNINAKRRVRWLPNGAKFTATKDSILKDEFDDYLARICCYCLSVAPNPLVKAMNRAASEQLAESAIEEGKLPLLGKISELMTMAVQYYFGPEFSDIEHVFNVDQQSDPHVQAEIHDVYLKNGTFCINMVLDDLGRDPVEGGDVHRVETKSGWMPVEGLDELSQATVQQMQAAATQPTLPPGSEQDGSGKPVAGQVGRKNALEGPGKAPGKGTPDKSGKNNGGKKVIQSKTAVAKSADAVLETYMRWLPEPEAGVKKKSPRGFRY